MHTDHRPVTFRRQQQRNTGSPAVIRRMAEAVVLLAAAVLLHFGTPHHSSASADAVSVMAPAIESESRKSHGPAVEADRAGTPSDHHDLAADALALPPRAATTDMQPSAVHDTTVDTAVTSAVGSGATHARTARDAWNPSAGTAPTPSTLQTFRC